MPFHSSFSTGYRDDFSLRLLVGGRLSRPVYDCSERFVFPCAIVESVGKEHYRKNEEREGDGKRRRKNGSDKKEQLPPPRRRCRRRRYSARVTDFIIR